MSNEEYLYNCNGCGKDDKNYPDKEIQDGLDDLVKGFHEMCVQSGWDVINYCFKIKGEK